MWAEWKPHGRIKDLNVRTDIIKLLEENISRTLSDINRNNVFFDPPPRVMKTKTKINKWDLMKLKSFCTAKETINKTKTIHTMGENICKQSNRQGINLQNIQTTHAAQYQKNKQPNHKMGRRSKQTFLQRTHTDGQEAHEKMLNMVNY